MANKELFAHCSKDKERTQLLVNHVKNVSLLMKQFCTNVNLSSLGELIGLIHDFGKARDEWQEYLFSDEEQKIPHSIYGAVLAFNFSGETSSRKLTREIIASVILGHHTELCDALSPDGKEYIEDKADFPENINIDDCSRFFTEIASKEEVNNLFGAAVLEIVNAVQKIKDCNTPLPKTMNFSKNENAKNIGNASFFPISLIVRFLYSCLIDADRLDAACWDSNVPLPSDSFPDWNKLNFQAEKYISGFKNDSLIGSIRNQISEQCKESSDLCSGIYELLVPTGGGKTLSSLRFALNHSIRWGKSKVFYIIPFNTIIEQSADNIRKALGEYSGSVLEHHSNIDNEIQESSNGDNDERCKLSERWDCPIVLTTQVQFFNAFFLGNRSAARRMHMLQNSVIILDEVQSIPSKLLNMFSLTIRFLKTFLNCTVVLCSATQIPVEDCLYPLALPNYPYLTNDVAHAFDQLRRVNIVDCHSQTMDTEELANFIMQKSVINSSVLVILNTKKAVLDVFNKLENLNVSGLFHLSTSMCAAHREAVFSEIRKRLGKSSTICISTNLIEAGVDISFDCVIRSLAGLDSIAQAAGRCNRNCEMKCRNAYIVSYDEGPLTHMPYLRKGQDATKRILNEFQDSPNRFLGSLLSPEAIKQYFTYFFANISEIEKCYPVTKTDAGGLTDVTMIDLLGINAKAQNAFEESTGFSLKEKQVLCQSFNSAGSHFSVIGNETRGVIVPYGNCEEIIDELLNASSNINTKIALLRKVQRYTVQLYDYQIKILDEAGAIDRIDRIDRIKEIDLLFLNKLWYNIRYGIDFSKEGNNPDDYIL